MNTYGNNFRITIFGASHNEFIGVTIDGCPAGLSVKCEDFFNDLNRRNCNYLGRTARKEQDKPQIISGIFEGFTTGMPVTILFENKDVQSENYSKFLPRPNHSDFANYKKFSGFNDYRGGGASSGRMTVALVAAGVLAKKIIPNIIIKCEVAKLHNSANFHEELQLAIARKDSIGGVLRCTISGIPPGVGEPFFNSLESNFSHLIFSIPGVKGIEFGAGFDIANRYGSEISDSIIDLDGTTSSNYSGGINGGISNGNEIYFSVAVRPTPSIFQQQETIDLRTGERVKLQLEGRHDVCFAMRMPAIIEAAAAIVLANFLLNILRK